MSNYVLYNGELYNADELKHYGILGMRWGIRRYQNKDGSLTDAGKKHYNKDDRIITKQDKYLHVSTKDTINFKNRITYVTDANSKVDFPIYAGKYALYLARTSKEVPYTHLLSSKKEGVIAGEKAMKKAYDILSTRTSTKTLLDEEMKRCYNDYKQEGRIKNNTSYEKFSKDKNRMFNLFTKTILDEYGQSDSKGTSHLRTANEMVYLGFAYTKILQKQKYSGMLDLKDKKSWYNAETPMMVFNGKRYVKTMMTKALFPEEAKNFSNNVDSTGAKNLLPTEKV